MNKTFSTDELNIKIKTFTHIGAAASFARRSTRRLSKMVWRRM